MFDLIGLDADDTLWYNESLYVEAQGKLNALLSSYASGEVVEASLYEKEMANLQHYGYGIKSFTLSMIEMAIELTEGKIPTSDIQKIIGFAKEMLTAEVQLFEHAAETVRELSRTHELIMITKGDLLDQESKLRRSGLGSYFHYIEIVSEKVQETYETLLEKHRIRPQRFLMVGNSLKSDILPVLALGGHAVYIPYHLTWAHETIADHHIEHDRCYELESIGQLPGLIRQLSALAR